MCSLFYTTAKKNSHRWLENGPCFEDACPIIHRGIFPCHVSVQKDTPWKINMEPTNHPFRKENDLNQTFIIMFQPLIFRGVVFL